MAISKFRPCIDLHGGRVKQIVGGTLSGNDADLQENFVSKESSAEFAEKFKADRLKGGHVIKLGPGNDEAACEALAAWKGGLQIGGGIRKENASEWLEKGASHVIITSAIFSKEGVFLEKNFDELISEVGTERLVLDLSCKRVGEKWVVAMNKWQTITELPLNEETLSNLASSCAEFLIHAADVEGLSSGMDVDLVCWMSEWAKRNTNTPITYAGGISSIQEVDEIQRLSEGYIDFTVGSALDLFGGDKISYRSLVARQK